MQFNFYRKVECCQECKKTKVPPSSTATKAISTASVCHKELQVAISKHDKEMADVHLRQHEVIEV